MDRINNVVTVKVKDTYKDIFLKTLNKSFLIGFRSKFTKNMIIIDDSLVKHILNNSEKVLLLVSRSRNKASPSNTFMIITLLLWLQ